MRVVTDGLERRPEPRPCVVCKRGILPGHLYVVSGPAHVVCRPPARLDVRRVAEAAKQR